MSDIIRNVVYRTNGEMFIGVVGSVRSGKSLFIRKFIEKKCCPMSQGNSGTKSSMTSRKAPKEERS